VLHQRQDAGVVNTIVEGGQAVGRGAEMFWNVDDEGAYYARQLMLWDENGDTTVQFARIVMTWVDVADLHPGTVTELEDGEVDDSEFTAAGWDYPIRIMFSAPEDSFWRISGGAAIHERGWPPVSGAPEGGSRG
jgi:hypothetical protein